MKNLVIIGAGTGGTIMARKMRKLLSQHDWNITVYDQYRTHYYQPGFLFVPFGTYKPEQVIKPKSEFIAEGVNFQIQGVEKIEADNNRIVLASGEIVPYDYLIIATGAHTAPEQTPGMKEDLWYKKIFDFYTYEGAVALSKFFETWQGGNLVINITELPIKCPVAPLEFAMLADEFFTKHGLRDKVHITYATPMSGAFTKPLASKVLGNLLVNKHIDIVTDFYVERIDNQEQKVYSYDGKELAFDCLVTVPVNMGDDLIARSGMGDDLNFVPTNKLTLQSEQHKNIFVIGDATNLPASKAGSVVHFEADILQQNLLDVIEGREPSHHFDGHSNCYIETGFGKAALIDFNYNTEPLTGKYPLPAVGPFDLLKESHINHYGKLMFRWVYWNILLKDRPLPVSSAMSMTGKIPADKTNIS